MRSEPPGSLKQVIAELARHYPAPAILTDPLELIVWENIGYLIDDERRLELFEEFRARVGFEPGRIALADDAALLMIAKRGGMRPETRVERWRSIARIALEDSGGDLDRTLRALPLGKARALLKRFPVIGDPGADKILLFCGLAPQPSLESNGLRALARLGFFAEQSSYSASYRAAIAVLIEQGEPDRDWLVSAHLALRAHGQALCRRSAPRCLPCPLDPLCAHAKVALL